MKKGGTTVNFIPKMLKKREARDRKHRKAFAEYLTNRIRIYQERLDNETFDDEELAVHLTQHVQRLRMIIDELDKANMQGQGLTRSAM